MEFTVYILQSQLDGYYYIGYTSYSKKRLSNHNSEKSYYTSSKLPWKVVYSERFAAKSDAIRRKKFLKNQRDREFYEKLIKKL